MSQFWILVYKFNQHGLSTAREYVKFCNKLNRIFCNQNVSNLLDNNEIDWQFMGFLKQLKRLHFSTSGYVQLLDRPRDYEFLEQPLTKAFLEENVLFYNKYSLTVKMQHECQKKMVDDYYNVQKSKSLRRIQN